MAVSPDNKFTVATSEQTAWRTSSTGPSGHGQRARRRVARRRIHARRKLVWVSAEIGGTVAVIDRSRKIVKLAFEIAGVPVQPVGVRFTKDGKTAFVALGPANRVAVVDVPTYAVKSYILVGQRPWHMALSADGTKLYVANGLTNDMTIVDVATLKPEKTVAVGRLPWELS